MHMGHGMFITLDGTCELAMPTDLKTGSEYIDECSPVALFFNFDFGTVIRPLWPRQHKIMR